MSTWFVRHPGHQLRDINFQKKGTDDGVPTASLMLKSAKGMEKKKKEV